MSNLTTRISSLRPSLPQAENRVAGYVLDNAASVPLQSVTQVAQGARVSVASVSRLSAKLGYPTFRELKIDLAQQTGTAPVQPAQKALSASDSDEEIVRKVFNANVRSLQDTLGVLNFEDLAVITRKIDVCRRLVFFGVGSAASVAHEAAYRFAQIDVQAEAYCEPHRMLAQSVRTTRQSVAVGICHSGQSRLVVESVRLARENGAYTVGITNFPRSPLGEVCDVALIAVFPPSKIKDFEVSSPLAQSCLMDALIALLAQRRKSLPTVERLRAIDEVP